MKFEKMFSPIQIGPMEVKNRFVVPPMGNNFANTDGTMSDQSVAYYGARAKGGFGLITLEATVVHKGAKGGPRKPCLYDDSAIPSFKKVIDAMQKELKFPFSYRTLDQKVTQRMLAHQSRQLQQLHLQMEEIFQKQLQQSRFMN